MTRLIENIHRLRSIDEKVGTHSSSSAGSAAGKVASRLSQIGVPKFEAERIGKHEGAHLSEASGLCAVAVTYELARLDLLTETYVLVSSLMIYIARGAYVEPLYEPSGEEMYRMAKAPFKIGDRPSPQDDRVSQIGLTLMRYEESQKPQDPESQNPNNIWPSDNTSISVVPGIQSENEDISWWNISITKENSLDENLTQEQENELSNSELETLGLLADYITQSINSLNFQDSNVITEKISTLEESYNTSLDQANSISQEASQKEKPNSTIINIFLMAVLGIIKTQEKPEEILQVDTDSELTR